MFAVGDIEAVATNNDDVAELHLKWYTRYRKTPTNNNIGNNSVPVAIFANIKCVLGNYLMLNNVM